MPSLRNHKSGGEEIGFTAMQRLTGWHASTFAILAAQGLVRRGAIPLELAAPVPSMSKEVRRRGVAIEELVVLPE